MGEANNDIYALLKSRGNGAGVACGGPQGYVVRVDPKGEGRHSLEEKGKGPEGDIKKEGGENRALRDSARGCPVGLAVGG